MFSYLCFATLMVAAYGYDMVQPVMVAPIIEQTGQMCPKRNGYLKLDGSCDSYIECRDYHGTTLLCPEGLNYNPSAEWPEYPCGYPMDVPCLNRGVPQPAKPTSECPHQYGFFPSLRASPQNCGEYRMCVEGRAIEMSCPVGLAFDEVSGRCDWADVVASCHADEFLGFKCPAPPVNADGELLDIVQNFEYQGDCFYFFSCDKGRARLLSCDHGFAFDPVSARCVDAEFTKCHMQEAMPQKKYY